MTLLETIAALDDDLRRAHGWRSTEVAAGARLFQQGDPVDALHVVADGRLSVRVDGVEVGVVEVGECLGEASVFFPGERRIGDAIARAPTRLWSLSRARVRQLQLEDRALYEQLLEVALSASWRRLEAKDREIVALGRGELPAPSRPGKLKQLWHRFRATATQAPDPIAALARVPVLEWSPRPILEAIAAHLSPVQVTADHALFLQGDDEQVMYVVAEGRLAIIREDANARAQELIVLEAGALFGAGGFVAGSPRSASAVARTDCWVLGLSREAADALGPPARQAFLEAVLATLRSQLSAANTLMARLKRPEESFEALLAAVGHLQGWQAGDPLTEVRLEDLVEPEPLPLLSRRDDALFTHIREGVIGGDEALATPFGLRRVVYADYTASGRSLTFIEDFIRDRVMPLYANTHTEASASGLQTTRFREEARALVARSVGAGPDDEVIFTGSGATSAINRLVDLLALRRPTALPEGATLREPPARQRPVVFIGPYEHHSNILPWRHSWADLVTIPVDAAGQLDLAALEAQLQAHLDRPLRVGSFSAGSNVTGVATDTVAVATLLHRYGALSLWDYAAAGPYVPIRMNPAGQGIDPTLAYKDAIAISPHKFVGGPGTPGVLVLKRSLAKHAVPTQPGGGTVDFVTPDDTLYSDSLTHREEAGTPAIIESIRCGLVFQLKDRVGAETIHHREQELVRTAIDAWSRNPAIRILGPLHAERLSIVSFMVRHGRGFLHHNFLVAVLNDLFGIQARGGCSCAGPYGAVLLGMDEDAGQAYLELAHQGYSALKPGWARVNFNYFLSAAEHRFIVQAVNLAAVYGWALMPDYDFDVRSGLWTHRDGGAFEPIHLGDLTFDEAGARWPGGRRQLPEEALEACLAEGREILLAAVAAAGRADRPAEAAALDAEVERWRWFPLPHEVAAWMERAEPTAEER